MNKKERFIYVGIYKDNTIKTFIGDFDSICEELEYQIDKIENKSYDIFDIQKMVVYDRQCSDSDMELNCYEEITDRIEYSQFIDKYYGDENL